MPKIEKVRVRDHLGNLSRRDGQETLTVDTRSCSCDDPPLSFQSVS